MSEQRYKIRRFFCNEVHAAETIFTGLTIEEAKEHCNDPETSSATCTNETGLARTETHGAWFDGYDRE